jgi:hypothetical protein
MGQAMAPTDALMGLGHAMTQLVLRGLPAVFRRLSNSQRQGVTMV